MTETFVGSELCCDLVFPEDPRWREGRLWISDMEDQCIKHFDLQGREQVVMRWNHYPSGLGWLPDGDLVFVSVQEQKLYRLDSSGQTHLHADLAGIAISYINDMVVDGSGRCYVGSMGFNVWGDETPQAGTLVIVEPDGQVGLGAADMLFPNGTVITPDGRTLIVAESMGQRLTAFDIQDDGALANRRCWAETGEASPDGICLDADGAVWVASPSTAEVLRISEGGEISRRIPLPSGLSAFAVMLGGEDGKRLFIMASTPMGDTQEDRLRKRPGKILYLDVEVAHAGLP